MKRGRSPNRSSLSRSTNAAHWLTCGAVITRSWKRSLSFLPSRRS
jgi:hypothetical protein